MAKPEIIYNLDDLSGDVSSFRPVGRGDLLIKTTDGGNFLFVREAGSQPVSVKVERSGGPDRPALRVQAEGRHDQLQAAIAVGPVEQGQKEAAARLSAEAGVLRSESKSLGGNWRLEREAARRIEQAERLIAGAAARVIGDKQTVKMAGQSIDGAPLAVALGKGKSGGGRQAEAETIVLGDRREEARFVQNASFCEAIADQRAQLEPSFLQRAVERIGYIVKGGQDPELARVDRLHERFEDVRDRAGQRNADELKAVKRSVLPVPSEADHEGARASVKGEVAAARQEKVQEDARISDWVTADTGHFGNEGGSGGGLGGFLSNILSGRMESGSYSIESMDTLNRFGPGTKSEY